MPDKQLLHVAQADYQTIQGLFLDGFICPA